MSSINVVSLSAWSAHGLAWAAGLFFAFGPVYEGVEVGPSRPGESAQEGTRVSATLIEANGLYVIFLLLIPILLTAIALVALRLPSDRQTLRKAFLCSAGVLLSGFCIVGIWSIGPFYLPCALALFVAVVVDLRRRGVDEPA